MLTSCSDKWVEGSKEEYEIVFSCGVAEYLYEESRTNPVDNSYTNRVIFNIGDEVALSCFPSSEDEDGDYKLYQLTDFGWSSTEEAFTWEASTMRFIGYYPTTATPTSFETPLDQSSAEKIAAADLMRLDMSVTQPDDNSVELSFTRQMAYIEVSVIKYGEAYSSSENYISDVKIYDYVEDESGVATISAITPYEVSSGVYSALIKGTSGVGTPPDYTLITFKDAKGNEYYLTNTTYLEPRYKHTISLVVGGSRDSVVVESIDVEPWGDPTYIDGGSFDVTYIDFSNCISFEDSSLKAALVQQHNYTLSDGTQASVIDTNGNGEIEFDEAAAATQVVIGVEYDPASYEDLYRYFDHITEFRHLKEIGTMRGDLEPSNLPNLRVLDLLSTTSRESYDLSGLPYLEQLYLFATSSTTSVDLSSNRNLTDLRMRVEGVQSIDLTNNIALESLHIEDTPLTTLDLSANRLLSTLYIESSQLVDLDLANNTKMKYITLETNEDLATLNMTGLVNLETLYCNVASIKSLDLSPFTTLRSLYWGYTSLESLSVEANVDLTYLRLEEPLVTTLDISNNNKISDFLARYVEHLTISQAQSTSPGAIYWASKISLSATIVVK